MFRDFKNAQAWYAGHNYHLTDVFGGGVNVVIPSRFGTSSIGGDVRGETVWSNVLGFELREPIRVPGEDGVFFTKSYNRNNASFFVEHNITLQRFSVSAGLLMNSNSQLGSDPDFFPGIDLSYWLTQNFKWMASFNKSLRLPTFTDLFYSGPTNQGNPGLKPEEATTLETGVRLTDVWYNAHAGVFYRKGRNLIDWGRLPGETKYTTSNINKVNAIGFEFSGSFDLLTAIPGQQWFRNLNMNYSYIHQDKRANAGFESFYVLDHLRNKLNIGFDHGTGLHNLFASWNFLYRDRVGYYNVSAINQNRPYKDFWLTDLRVTWKQRNLRIFVEATNLFNEKYADLGELTQPGRWFKGGIQVDFGY